MRICITGHLGFLGSYFKKQFKADGWDLKEGNDIASLLLKDKYDLIINCAGEIWNKDSMIWTNVHGLDVLAKFCSDTNTKLIHFSTASVYGDSWYGITKRMGEEVIRHHNPKDWLILRLTGIYGEGGDTSAYLFEKGDNTIFGDGYHIKDFVHIRDLIKAVELAIKDNWTGEINLGGGKPATVNEIFKRFGKGKPKYLKDKKPDMFITYLDNSRALELGWRPSWSIYDK